MKIKMMMLAVILTLSTAAFAQDRGGAGGVKGGGDDDLGLTMLRIQLAHPHWNLCKVLKLAVEITGGSEQLKEEDQYLLNGPCSELE